MKGPRAIAETTRGASGRLAIWALVAMLTACGLPDEGGPEATDPSAALALALFDLARAEDPQAERLAATFSPAPRDERQRAELLDALAPLREAGKTRVVEVQYPAGPDDAFVDLEAELPGGGSARYSVRVQRVEPGEWRVSSFQGPGHDWPPSRRLPEEGLTTSAAPEDGR